MKNSKQSGFYLIETLISLQIFFISVLTLLPIQQQIYLEKKLLQEKDKVVYFLSEEMNQAIIDPPEKKDYRYENVLPTPINITYSKSDSLLEGCVHWVNAKQKEEQICLYIMQE